MACNFNIKVVEQNDFTICIPLKKRTFVASTPIDEDIDILALEDLSVKIGGAVFPATRDAAGVMVDVSRDALARGTYDVVLTATYKGHAIKAAYFDSLTIVEWNCQSDAQQCVQGSPIMFEAGFVIYNLTDAELTALKEEYRLKIAAAEEAKEEAEQAKEEYIAKAEALDDVAQQSTLTHGVQDIREDISHIDIDTSNLAKQGSNAGATLTDTQAAAQQAASDAADAKTAAQAIAGYALQGNDPTKTNTQLSAEIGQIALNAQTLQSLADSWAAMVTNRQTLNGYTFTDSIDVENISSAVFRQDQLLEIDDDSVTIITVDTPLQAAISLRKLRLANCVQSTQRSFLYNRSTMIELDMPSLEVLGGPNSLQGLTNLSVLNMPNLKQISGTYVFDSIGVENVSLPSLLNFGGDRIFNNATKMKECHVPNLQVSRNSIFLGCTNLILLELGENMTSSFNISGWSPTNALNASSQTLLTPEDIAAGFTSNLQKLLYNIREHIAANLPVANNTVTFSSAVKAAILADQTTADAFTNKGWTIA